VRAQLRGLPRALGEVAQGREKRDDDVCVVAAVEGERFFFFFSFEEKE
jgi:hypothetical protein